MKKAITVALIALLAGACSNETTGPDSNPDIAALSSGEFGTALTMAGGYDAETYQNRLFNALPDDIALTDAQKAQIKSLVQAFVQSTKTDRADLTAILKEAADAVRSGKSRADVQAILDKGKPIRDRLSAAESKLKSDIDSILTADQRAWITSHAPRSCRADKFPPLTDAQKAQIRSLETEFQSAHQADLSLLKSIYEEAEAAARAGKSRDDIASILAKAVDPLKRLAAARTELRMKILAILTPEQKASGCLPLG
jgi:Spy/CpxP family protein refolding chaperone